MLTRDTEPAETGLYGFKTKNLRALRALCGERFSFRAVRVFRGIKIYPSAYSLTAISP